MAQRANSTFDNVYRKCLQDNIVEKNNMTPFVNFFSEMLVITKMTFIEIKRKVKIFFLKNFQFFEFLWKFTTKKVSRTLFLIDRIWITFFV